jgi:small conductance mechanosensitive channel
MDTQKLLENAQQLLTKYGLLLIGAVLMWIVGRWLIGFVARMLRKGMNARQVDATLQNYLVSIITVALNIILVIAILSQFGVETTSFAAIMAAAAFAIGAAWGGLLANFAAGAFLLVLRPFKVGDLIGAGGTIGIVDEIGLFSTTVTTPDGVQVFIGNNKLFGDNIHNYSTNPHRRVDRTMQLAHGVDVNDAIARIKHVLSTQDGVLQEPAPEVWVIDYTMAGPVLAVRPYSKPKDYWKVYQAANDAIRQVGGEASLPAPFTHQHVTQVPAR